MKYSLIITAGGSSTRYGSNKLLEKLGDKTVIEKTISAFIDFNCISEIIIPTNKSFIENFSKILKDKRIKIIEGGNSRQESVFKALQEVKNDFVIIHDAARPLIDKTIIKQVINDVTIYDAVSVMIKTTDTIKEVNNDGFIIRTIDRSKLYNTQTPQAFKTDFIKTAHERLKDKNYTDDSSMLEELGYSVHIVEGNYKNIKITTKSDLEFAKIYI